MSQLIWFVRYVMLFLLFTGVVACNGSSDGSGSSSFSAFKNTFIVPVKDSVLATGDTVNLATTNSIQPTAISVHDITDKNRSKFDLKKEEINSCASLTDYSEQLEKDYSTDASLLETAFASTSDKAIPAFLAGEYSYVSTFRLFCDIQEDPPFSVTLEELSSAPKHFTSPIGDSDAVTLTYDLTNDLYSEQLQELYGLSSDFPAFDKATTADLWTGTANNVKFSRVYQARAVNSSLQFSVVHHVNVILAKGVKNGYPTGDASKLESMPDNNFVLQQKFTIVATNEDNSRQYIGFFSSYPYDTGCAGSYEGNTYKIDYVDQEGFTTDLQCQEGTTSIGKPFRDFSTDAMLYVAGVDAVVGAITSRAVCTDITNNGGYYNLGSTCSSTNGDGTSLNGLAIGDGDSNDSNTETYDEIESPNDEQRKRLEKATKGITLFLNQLKRYAELNQFPATLSKLAELQGNISDGKARDRLQNLVPRKYLDGLSEL